MTELLSLGAAAKAASRTLALCGTNEKNAALLAIADALEARADEILSANAEDLEAAERAGMRASLLDRLRLTRERIASVAAGVRDVSSNRSWTIPSAA